MNNASNAPVVFINGLIGTLNDPEIHRQLGDRPFLAPDLYGYGNHQGTPVGNINIQGQVERIREVVEAEFNECAVNLVGHSVGGVVAYAFAHRYPERVKSLVSVEGNFTLKDAFWSSSVANMSVEQAETMLEGFRADPEAWLERSGILEPAGQTETAKTWLAHQPASTLQAIAQSVVAVTGRPDYQTILRSVFASVPVHLLAGEHSVGGWDVPDWANKGATSLTIMPDVGHLMMLQHPAAFGRLVAGLLA
ncbi:alpha/beta fold hydrolase [Pseudomonas abietaniphila]|uniref:Pimeloyl-ACP methyl ester carboxylesterase n=1 Tax=Pseudomonas abietaniphila TaxID=89065 RepID=A0A1G8RRA0_9PSED|nr:alpha/beta hydrolase [Pseudomonas abietaniphila]SDJ19443.1 Pimeloyl-ACP methyl ester carboxylesterase [Pseudomonas abietaniphila]